VDFRPSRLVAILAFLACAPVAAEEVVVFAAASLGDVLDEIGRGWAKRTGHTVVFSVGGLERPRAADQGRRAADVFFSADKGQMDGLEEAGLVRAADRVDLLSNTLVVVVPRSATTRIEGPADLIPSGPSPSRTPRRSRPASTLGRGSRRGACGPRSRNR
jgi:molybdate transport system substrate-binding protein